MAFMKDEIFILALGIIITLIKINGYLRGTERNLPGTHSSAYTSFKSPILSYNNTVSINIKCLLLVTHSDSCSYLPQMHDYDLKLFKLYDFEKPVTITGSFLN